MRAATCLCGDWIVAPSLDESAPAVYEHTQSEKHRKWREQGGMETLEPTVRRIHFGQPPPSWDAYEGRKELYG